MIVTPLHINIADKRDPTRTTTLRNVFVRQMTKRFSALAALIKKAVDDEDVFGLKDPGTQGNVITYGTTPGRRRFAFPRSSDKVSAFMEWLRIQIQNDILQVTSYEQVGRAVESAWTNLYISDSYKRGVTRARQQLISGGMNVPSLAASGGIAASMATPFHLDRVGLLYTRTFNELKGITDAMDQQISRVLTQGLSDGLSPRTIARKLVYTIKGGGGELGVRDTLGRYIPAKRRATILARTEIIRAHSEAQLQEFENWGVVGVSVQAEWITAGDARVCSECSANEGSIYTLEEARGLIPWHAQCRCAWLPYIPQT